MCRGSWCVADLLRHGRTPLPLLLTTAVFPRRCALMRLSPVCRPALPTVLSVLIAGFITLGAARPASAATLTVCASGCAYSSFQQALNASQPGDTILLRAGETFVGQFVLPAKSGSNTTPILIRSDASDSALPASGVRLVPPG